MDRLEQYGRFIGARYRDFPNIIWIEGGDLTPSTSGDPSEMDLVNAVANGVAAGDGGAHYHAAHWGRGTSGADLPDLSWLDIDTTYATFEEPVYEQVLADYDRDAGVMPLLPPRGVVRERARHVDATGLRSQMYQPRAVGRLRLRLRELSDLVVLGSRRSGLAVEDGAFPGGWATALGSEGQRVLAHCGRVLPFPPVAGRSSRTPTGVIVTAGSRKRTGRRHTRSPRALRTAAVVVVQFTGPLTVTIDMSALPRPMRARFLDPAIGVYTELPGSPLPASGLREISPPGLNGDGSEDWLRILEAT